MRNTKLKKTHAALVYGHDDIAYMDTSKLDCVALGRFNNSDIELQGLNSLFFSRDATKHNN